MKRFSDFVIKSKAFFVVLFVLLTIVGIFCIFQIIILYDLSSYVPSGSDTEKAVTLLKEEFDDKGAAYVMVSGVSREEAAQLCTQLSQLEGVAIATYDAEKDYKDGSVLYTVSLSNYDSTSQANATIERLLSATEDKVAYVSGQSASSYGTRQATMDGVVKMGVIIVIAIFAMLLFTSTTYFELVLMLAVFLVAVVLNMGTNCFFSGISYISNLIALVLQLALSIDYSVVLLHRYMQERETLPATEAASAALSKGLAEIVSGSLTTVGGLCALMLMSLPIGVEMGIALAKGIVFSLITVVFFMPALLVYFDKQLMGSKHKFFVPDITKIARKVVRGKYVIVPVFIVMIGLSFWGQLNNTYGFNLNSSPDTLTAQEETAKVFGYKNTLVVMVPKGDRETEKELIAYVCQKPLVNGVTALTTIEITDGLYLTDTVTLNSAKELCASLGFPEIAAQLLFTRYASQQGAELTEDYSVEVLSLLEYTATQAETLGLSEYAAQLQQLGGIKANFEGERYTRIMFNLNCTGEDEAGYRLYEELKEELPTFYSEFYMAGETAVCYDMATAFPLDNLKVCVFTIVIVLLILLFTYRNILLPVLLISVIQGGIWINFVIPFLLGNSVFFIGYLLICAIQMGATIDYAIILTGRYNAIKITALDRDQAMAQAENAVFPTIITSGVILSVAGLTLGLASTGIVFELGILLGLGAVMSVLAVLFVLPSLLLVFDKAVDKCQLGKKERP